MVDDNSLTKGTGTDGTTGVAYLPTPVAVVSVNVGRFRGLKRGDQLTCVKNANLQAMLDLGLLTILSEEDMDLEPEEAEQMTLFAQTKCPTCGRNR